MKGIDIHIIRMAIAGDIEAFEQIYEALSGFVYSVAIRITRNAEDAQEVTQDVFMKVYRNLKNFQFRSSVRTWVYRIAVTTALNYCRRNSRQREGRVEYDGAAESVSTSHPSSEGETRSDNEMILQELLKRLNPEQKICLILREIEGLRYKEISQILRIPINTVRSRLKRARQALLEHSGKGVVKNEL